MKRPLADWQGLCYREGGVRLWCTCHVCGLSLTMIRDPEMRRCATCDSVEIHCGAAHADVPLWLCLAYPLRHGDNF